MSVLDQVFGANLPFSIQYMPDNHQLGFRARKSKLTSVYAKKASHAISKLADQPVLRDRTIVGTEYISLSPDLRVQIKTTAKDASYSAAYSLADHNWTVRLSQTSSRRTRDCYTIRITPPARSKLSPVSAVTAAQLISQARSPHSLLALWKAYELLVHRYLSKDDLVQLFGYYQYKMAFSVGMDLIDGSLTSSTFWRVVQFVTTGCGVGTISPVEEIASLYEMSHDDLLTVLTQMKELGYEIRNHRTNPQIPHGMILIPYSFPTLNERSLQRLTRL